MNKPKLNTTRGARFALAQTSLALLVICLFTVAAQAGEPMERKATALPEPQFQEKLRTFERLRNHREQARESAVLLRNVWLSSQQVKAIARTITDENARFDFALAAYPRTVDPENFYDVYDAFTSYSKVFRLHDQIQQLRQPTASSAGSSVRGRVRPISDEAMAALLKAVRSETFEDNKLSVARQMFAGKRRFLSRQVGELIRLFNFDNARLEIAELAYDSVVDPENYHLVSQSLTFSSSKEKLARYIQDHDTERHAPSRH